jgi:hypothetical protein
VVVVVVVCATAYWRHHPGHHLSFSGTLKRARTSRPTRQIFRVPLFVSSVAVAVLPEREVRSGRWPRPADLDHITALLRGIVRVQRNCAKGQAVPRQGSRAEKERGSKTVAVAVPSGLASSSPLHAHVLGSFIRLRASPSAVPKTPSKTRPAC